VVFDLVGDRLSAWFLCKCDCYEVVQILANYVISAGDGLDAALAMMVARDCDKIDGGLPAYLRSLMLMNIVLDFFIGLVPFIGDIADAIYKCNTRNAILLEKHLRDKSNKAEKAREKRGTQRRHDQRPVDLSVPEEFDRYEEGMLPDPPRSIEDPISEPISAGHNVESRRPAEPQYSHESQSTRRDTDWFSGRRQKPRDVESGGGRDH